MVVVFFKKVVPSVSIFFFIRFPGHSWTKKILLLQLLGILLPLVGSNYVPIITDKSKN